MLPPSASYHSKKAKNGIFKLFKLEFLSFYNVPIFIICFLILPVVLISKSQTDSDIGEFQGI